ncbi:conjugal transfer protein TrbP [Stenotrophomonas maltophilia AU12-09]|nr:conjugal transfer protein TrbP [Stenotrophomonas maltophilia AU12-09]
MHDGAPSRICLVRGHCRCRYQCCSRLLFALCAAAIYAAGQRRWTLLAFAATVLPAFVDYQWAGVGFVLLAWLAFHRQQYWLLAPAFAAICWFNGNLWALGAIPVALCLSRVAWSVPRGRWMGLLRVLRGPSGVPRAGGAYTAAVSTGQFLGAQASGGCYVHKDCSRIAAVCTRRACGSPADLQVRYQGRDRIPVNAVRER